MRLADLNDPDHFYQRGFLLSLSKSNGFGMNRINTRKAFPIRVKHSRLPVMVFSPRVVPE
jgi:hypothetical protein